MGAEQHVCAAGGRRLIAGLGNPGPRYAATRHNVGFMVVDRLARSSGVALSQRKFQAEFGTGRVAGVPVVLVKPMAFMNRSGPPVQQLAAYFRLSSRDVIVVHDDIDLAFGRIKIKEKGGHGGHNGIRSLMAAFGTGDFTRLRIGIGRPENGCEPTGHVLGPFRGEEMAALDEIIARAQDAVVTILAEGTQAGMNRFNRRESTS